MLEQPSRLCESETPTRMKLSRVDIVGVLDRLSWTFVRQEGIEPTNNAAERALRHAGIRRRLSSGTQSAGGSRFVATLLTVIETRRQ